MGGGNNTLFGDVARACVYQPRPNSYGPAWDEDPEGAGKYMKNIEKSASYVDGPMAEEYTSFSDDVVRDWQKRTKNPQGTLDLYLSSYVLFFNAEKDTVTGMNEGLSKAGRDVYVVARVRLV